MGWTTGGILHRFSAGARGVSSPKRLDQSWKPAALSSGLRRSWRASHHLYPFLSRSRTSGAISSLLVCAGPAEGQLYLHILPCHSHFVCAHPSVFHCVLVNKHTHPNALPLKFVIYVVQILTLLTCIWEFRLSNLGGDAVFTEVFGSSHSL